MIRWLVLHWFFCNINCWSLYITVPENFFRQRANMCVDSCKQYCWSCMRSSYTAYIFIFVNTSNLNNL